MNRLALTLALAAMSLPAAADTGAGWGDPSAAADTGAPFDTASPSEDPDPWDHTGMCQQH